MARGKDLTGMIFGNLTVIRRATKEEKAKGVYWMCQCSNCDNIVFVTTGDLNRRVRKYCSNCQPNKKSESLVGEVFGKLTVVEPDKNKDNYWICKCECGNSKSISRNSLKSGCSNSCGCLRKETTRERGHNNKSNLVGKTFGRLTVVGESSERYSDGCLLWECKCECGNTHLVTSTRLTSGTTTSCGCLAKEVARDKFVKLNSHQRGELHPNWKGTSNIKTYLSGNINLWKKDMLAHHDYTCDISGQRGGTLNVHHLKALSTIIDEAHAINDIQPKELVSSYTEEELKLLVDYVKSQHSLDSGVVLTEELHREFHKTYGYGYNTPEQYYEFKQLKQLSTSSNVA